MVMKDKIVDSLIGGENGSVGRMVWIQDTVL